jgi:hypothetical protein
LLQSPKKHSKQIRVRVSTIDLARVFLFLFYRNLGGFGLRKAIIIFSYQFSSKFLLSCQITPIFWLSDVNLIILDQLFFQRTYFFLFYFNAFFHIIIHVIRFLLIKFLLGIWSYWGRIDEVCSEGSVEILKGNHHLPFNYLY